MQRIDYFVLAAQRVKSAKTDANSISNLLTRIQVAASGPTVRAQYPIAPSSLPDQMAPQNVRRVRRRPRRITQAIHAEKAPFALFVNRVDE